jgi:hypothetical protein
MPITIEKVNFHGKFFQVRTGSVNFNHCASMAEEFIVAKFDYQAQEDQVFKL